MRKYNKREGEIPGLSPSVRETGHEVTRERLISRIFEVGLGYRSAHVGVLPEKVSHPDFHFSALIVEELLPQADIPKDNILIIPCGLFRGIFIVEFVPQDDSFPHVQTHFRERVCE
jgi:hypothetical protein